MNLVPDEFKVKRGDPVQPAVEKLLMHLPEIFRPYTTSANVRFMRGRRGVNVVAEDRVRPYIPRFMVSSSELKASVLDGFLAIDQVPTLPTVKGVPLDGKMKDGKTKPKPTISMESGPNEDLRSWICLQVTLEENKKVNLKDREDALTVVHTNTMIPPSWQIGWQPLAMVVWKDKKAVTRTEQIVLHNLNYAFRASSIGTGGKHFFWAV